MYGYGNEDLFSPLRTEASFNDSPYNSQRDSGSMSEFLQGQNAHMEKNMGDIVNQKRNNLHENVNSRSKINGSKEQPVFNISKIREENKQMAAIQSDFLPSMNFDDIMFGNPFEKDFGMESSILENKHPYPNKRSRTSSLSGKDYPEMNYNPKPINTTLKSKQAKQRYSDGLQNYVSSKPETRRSREQIAEKVIPNNTQFPVNNNLLKCADKKEVEIIDLESIDTCENNPELNKTVPISTSNEVQPRLVEPECECVSEIIRTPKRNSYDCCSEEINVCAPAIPNYTSQQQLIQTNIIEKLIKETVNVEFDAIRQLLYLQQMSLFRHLHKNLDVFENHNSSNSEFMLKVIEELMHENRQLKKAVVAHQRRT